MIWQEDCPHTTHVAHRAGRLIYSNEKEQRNEQTTKRVQGFFSVDRLTRAQRQVFHKLTPLRSYNNGILVCLGAVLKKYIPLYGQL
ncbi:hypothetical protein Y1Q_0004635 [Alligator mississippiensis]|uniref:Uncharacterized protein n=1 Tax=Alligator mississippiensis TaxID=8496 RepID=A0A151MHP9_ALLMI|nr:hypothetical protein Y1Q_0004635 [Alligator mississippiensis]